MDGPMATQHRSSGQPAGCAVSHSDKCPSQKEALPCAKADISVHSPARLHCSLFSPSPPMDPSPTRPSPVPGF